MAKCYEERGAVEREFSCIEKIHFKSSLSFAISKYGLTVIYTYVMKIKVIKLTQTSCKLNKIYGTYCRDVRINLYCNTLKFLIFIVGLDLGLLLHLSFRKPQNIYISTSVYVIKYNC